MSSDYFFSINMTSLVLAVYLFDLLFPSWGKINENTKNPSQDAPIRKFPCLLQI